MSLFSAAAADSLSSPVEAAIAETERCRPTLLTFLKSFQRSLAVRPKAAVKVSSSSSTTSHSDWEQLKDKSQRTLEIKQQINDANKPKIILFAKQTLREL